MSGIVLASYHFYMNYKKMLKVLIPQPSQLKAQVDKLTKALSPLLPSAVATAALGRAVRAAFDAGVDHAQLVDGIALLKKLRAGDAKETYGQLLLSSDKPDADAMLLKGTSPSS